jgi:hypothetical protein
MHTLNGSCNCGAIRYRVSGEIRSIVNCHCKRSHKVSELAEKHFCGTCGTPLFNSSARYAGLTILHLGSIDDSLDMEPRVNIYCESRLDWLHKLPEIPDLDRGF